MPSAVSSACTESQRQWQRRPSATVAPVAEPLRRNRSIRAFKREALIATAALADDPLCDQLTPTPPEPPTDPGASIPPETSSAPKQRSVSDPSSEPGPVSASVAPGALAKAPPKPAGDPTPLTRREPSKDPGPPTPPE